MHTLYYVSSHGYGHGVRSCAICNNFSKEVSLTIRSNLPEQFFQEELSRPFSYYPGEFDCGCIQTDGVTVDIKKTLQTYLEIAKRNESVLEDEVCWCKEHDVTGIVSDIAPFPFEVAFRAGIPSIGISNFSWEDIYESYLEDMPEFETCFETIKNQYAMADLLLALYPSNPMKSFNRRKEVPVVGRKGKNKKEEIRKRYTIGDNKKIGLIYTGDFGMDSASWKKLESFDKWEFVGAYPIPGNPSNYRLITKNEFTYQDISASVDLMISKIGYGVYSECLINGVPLIYLPRTDFAEYPVLEKAVQEWRYGYFLSHNDYFDLKWGTALEKMGSARPSKRDDCIGDQICAREVESFFTLDN
jgi:hypothetical protein